MKKYLKFWNPESGVIGGFIFGTILAFAILFLTGQI